MATNDTWEFDFDGWTLGEDAMYMTQLVRARETGDYRPLFPHWARMIRQWPFAARPGDPRSYMQLEESMLLEIIERINRGIYLGKRPDGRTGGGET